MQHSEHFTQQTHAYPVHEGQVHSHDKRVSGEVNALGEVGEELMIKGLHPIGITTLHGQGRHEEKQHSIKLIVKLDTHQIQYPAKCFGILINIGGLQMLNQLLYCSLVGELYFTGDVTRNMTRCSGVTTTVVTLQNK